MKSIPEQIREAMTAKDIGIEVLAVKAGVHSQTLRKLLHGGNVNIDTASKVAEALKIILTL
jgi:DNA-binding phage protein